MNSTNTTTSSATVSEKSPAPSRPRMEAILLGCVTALIVARPLVASDDPGRLRPTSGGGPLTLNLLTFLVAIAWAIWHGCTRRRVVIGGSLIISIGLLVVAGCVFASAAGLNRYPRPGWFIAWDWVALAVLVFLTSQLTINAAVSRGLFAVLIAMAGCLAVQALYEEAAVRSAYLPRTIVEPVPPTSMALVGDDEFGLKLNDPPVSGTMRATLDRPETLAGFLLLFFPLVVLWSLAGQRIGGRARGIAMASLVIGLALAMALIAWFIASPIAGHGWRAARDMIDRGGWLGVGPGGFTRNAGIGIQSPGSFWLGFAATAGLLAAFAFGITILLTVFWLVRRRHVASTKNANDALSKEHRWAFYFGGVVGLLLGMILATGDIPAEASPYEMLRLGLVAGGRALVWFLIFAALELVSPDQRTLKICGLVGVLLTALLGIIADGLGSPALLMVFAQSASLCLYRERDPSLTKPSPLVLAWIGALLAVALLIANFIHVGLPGLATTSAVRGARFASREFPAQHLQTEGKSGIDEIQAVHRADNFLVGYILQPLRDALKDDPGNSALMMEIVRWDRWKWHYLMKLRQGDAAQRYALEMLRLDETAARVDPLNPATRLSEFEATLLFTRQSPAANHGQLQLLDRLIRQIAERDPKREVNLRYRVVANVLALSNPEIVDSWAAQLLRLDALSGEPHGRMTKQQQVSLLQQLTLRIQQPSDELKLAMSRAR